MTAPFQTLLLTGAAGTLGRHLAPGLLPLAERLVVSDLPLPLAQAALPPSAQAVPCDLADAAAVLRLLEGVDAVVHLGGVSVEGPWEPILQANICGLHHLYEAARRQGT
jgi:uronate dehydrogenase